MKPRSLAIRCFRRGGTPFVRRHLRLPFAHWLACMEGGEPELLILERVGPNRGTAVDIGANEGLYTYRLSKLYDRVLAFEINNELTANLRAYAAKRNIEVHGIGLSCEDAAVKLFVPLFRGRPLYGWASLRPGNLPKAEGHLELPVRVRTLDSYELSDVTFIKADVEGHELELVAGARDTIRRNRPVVLLEVKEGNRRAVSDFFRELGYVERRLEDLTGVRGSPENFIYVPL